MACHDFIISRVTGACRESRNGAGMLQAEPLQGYQIAMCHGGIHWAPGRRLYSRCAPLASPRHVGLSCSGRVPLEARSYCPA